MLVDNDFVEVVGRSLLNHPEIRPHVTEMVSHITKLVSRAMVEDYVNDSTKEINHCLQEMNAWTDRIAKNHDQLQQLINEHEAKRQPGTSMHPGQVGQHDSPPPSDDSSDEDRRKKKKRSDKKKNKKKKKAQRKKHESDTDDSSSTGTQNSGNDSD